MNLRNCSLADLDKIKFRLHPATERRTLIFTAGALNNVRLQKELGSNELSIFLDGMVSAGNMAQNPYWPHYGRKK